MNVKDVDESSITEGSCTSPGLVNEFSEPITLKEVKKGVKSLKNNTSVGYDCISNEMLRPSQRGYLFPCSPEINWLVPLFPKY